MSAALIIYLLVILALVYKNGFFGVFKDEHVSIKTFSLLFFFKALAIPAFYFVYANFYGGLERFDAGVFYNDAKAVNAFARTNFAEYLKLLVGLQDDSEGSYIYNHCLVYTNDWDNGKIRDFFYNDNRVVIRLHSLLHFIAFNSYFVHALFNCFLSFIGITYLYKALKEFFPGRELFLLLIFCFFPTLWFYTGAVLKEGITLLVLGCSLYCLKQLIYKHAKIKHILALIFLLFVSCFLKPYLLCSAMACFAVFFVVHRYQSQYKVVYFLSAIALLTMAANGLALLTRHKSLPDAAFDRQRIFADAAKGGIFLLDSVKFVRLDYDSALIEKTGPDHYRIKKNVPYIYWEHTHQQDTLFCAANADTLHQYKLVYELRESGSNFDAGIYSGSRVKQLANCLYYTLFYPLFFNARGALQLLASFENLLIIISLAIFILGFVRSNRDSFPVLAFMCFALGLCILVGFTTPNSGAIFRYRSPAVIFILASALYYCPPLKSRLFKNPN